MCCLLFLLHTMQWTTILGCGQKEIRCWCCNGCNVLSPLPPAHDAMDHHTGVRSEGDSMMGLQWLQCAVSSSSCTRCNGPPYWDAVRRRFDVGVAMCCVLFLLHTMQWTTILGCGQKEIRCWGCNGCNVLSPLPPAHDAMNHHTGVRSGGDSLLGLQWLQYDVSSSALVIGGHTALFKNGTVYNDRK